MSHAVLQDATETNVINLRRTIYLTIMSAMDFEEAGHKLLKIDLADGQESEVVLMIIECCSQEKTYLKSAPADPVLHTHAACRSYYARACVHAANAKAYLSLPRV